MFTKKAVMFLFALFLSSIIQPCYAIPPADNSSPNKVHVNDRIFASMSGVDDIGLVIVWNGHGAETVLKCSWAGGVAGSASGDIASFLTKGDNYIIYVCYNRVYHGGFFFAGGKWAYSFSISKNGNTFWEKSDYRRENDAAIKYWKVIKANVDGSGRVGLTDTIDSNALGTLRDAMRALEEKLDRNVGVATPFE